jgi:hypothetical protein
VSEPRFAARGVILWFAVAQGKGELTSTEARIIARLDALRRNRGSEEELGQLDPGGTRSHACPRAGQVARLLRALAGPAVLDPARGVVAEEPHGSVAGSGVLHARQESCPLDLTNSAVHRNVHFRDLADRAFAIMGRRVHHCAPAKGSGTSASSSYRCTS